MKKLFYKCPIESAYMAKNFGVKYRVGNNSNLEWHEFVSGNWQKDERKFPDEYYYIHPDSLSIFEPQKGDLVGMGRKQLFPIEGSVGVKEIIQRNGKAFIMPEVENDQ